MLLRSFLSLYLPEKYESDHRHQPKPSPRRGPTESLSFPVHSLVASLSPHCGAQDLSDVSLLASNAPTPLRGYLTLIFGLLFQISLGMLWTYGNVIPYIASYITYYESSATVLTGNIYTHYYSLTNWSFFLLFTALTFGVLLGGKFEIYFGPKISIILSSVFVILGFGGTFIALLLHNIYVVLLTYGVLFGFGVGLGYPILTIVCMRWFPKVRARTCGIISGVFGGSPLLWDYIQTYIVNPNAVLIDPELGYANSPQIINRIPYMFLYIACMQFIMQIIALSVVTNPPWYVPEIKQKNNKIADNDESVISREQTEYEMHSLNMKMTLKLPTFWSLWINNFLYSFVLMWVAAEWKEFAMLSLQIDSDQYLAIIGSVSALMNGIGRFSWGFIYDFNKSFQISMGTMTAIVAIAIGTMPMINVWVDNARILFAIWIFVVWICVGCQYAFLPTCIAETFGAKYTGSIVGLFVWCEAPASLLVVVCTEFYIQLFNGWTGYCIVIASCSAVSFVLSIFYKSDIDRQKILESYERKHDQDRKYGKDDESLF